MSAGRLYSLTCVLRVVDGDTLHVVADLGFGLSLRIGCRLARIDAPELPTPQGVAAKQWLTDVIERTPVGGFDAICHGKDKYGRWLVELVIRQSGVCVNDLMVSQGIAVPMRG